MFLSISSDVTSGPKFLMLFDLILWIFLISGIIGSMSTSFCSIEYVQKSILIKASVDRLRILHAHADTLCWLSPLGTSALFARRTAPLMR